MKNTRSLLAVIGILFASFCGGAMSHRLLSAERAEAEDIEPGNPKYFRATNLYIVDDASKKVRGIFNVDAQGTVVVELRDKNDQARGRLVCDTARGNPQLSLLDSSGNARASLVVSDDTPVLELTGQGGQLGVLATVEDTPSVSLTDGAGAVRAQMALGEDGTGSLKFFDAKGAVLWQAPQPPDTAQPTAR